MGNFEELYRKHVQSVYRFALSCVGRIDIAEDIASETFLALYRNLEQIDESQLPGWLIAVARNRARSFWRHQAVELRYAQGLPDSRGEAPPLELWILESKDLKPIHRMCLMLRYVQGMSRGEIVAQTGLTDAQVKGHLQYALQLLRKSYKGEA
jgi:RNA polymerase sigma-70 factor (ECF subfamily)